jgi:hypothetical protein
MGTLYMAVPRATTAPFDLVEVTTGTALKSTLQVAPAGTDIRVHGWSFGGKGVAAADPPGRVSLIDAAVAATAGTALTPEEWEGTDGQPSLAIGGTALTAYNLTEPTHTGVRYLDAQEVHPQSGYGVWFPEGRRPVVKAGRFVVVRVLFTVSISCLPWVVWEEPA